MALGEEYAGLFSNEKGKFDIAGFSVGIVDQKKILKGKIFIKVISYLYI